MKGRKHQQIELMVPEALGSPSSILCARAIPDTAVTIRNELLLTSITIITILLRDRLQE